MWVDLLFEKWISQKFSDFENLLYVGVITTNWEPEIVGFGRGYNNNYPIWFMKPPRLLALSG